MTIGHPRLSDEIGVITRAFDHKAYLREVLERIERTDQLVRFLHRYTLYNGNFAGGVALLAGRFHIRQDLFREEAEPIGACADRSARVASLIFFAAEDEYSDRGDHTRITHRDLGQAVLRATVDHFGIAPEIFDETYPLNATTERALETVLEGYCATVVPSDDDLFRGLGFHIASETSADEEFIAITSYLREAQPGLVDHLSDATTHLGQATYRWLDLHTYVEVEHHQHAVEAAEVAEQYYSGDAPRERIRELVAEGVNQFATSLRGLMSGILDPD